MIALIHIFLPGKLNLTFDANGEVLTISGNPILLEPSIPQDNDFLQLLEVYRPEVEAVNKEIIGTLQVTLDGNTCREEECNYGNLVADANVLYNAVFSTMTWTDAPIGLVNGGGIRTTVEPGPGGGVTRGNILASLPFGKQTVTLTLKGSALVKTLELGIRSNGETARGEFLQVSGLKVVYDKSKPAMSRVVSVKTRCGLCDIPTYENIDINKNYTVVTTDFLADGNDGHYVLKEEGLDRKQLDLGDVDVLIWYFKTYSPVYVEVQDRISFIVTDDEKPNKAVISTASTFCISVLLLILYFS